MRLIPTDLNFLFFLFKEIQLECSDNTEKYLASLSLPLVREQKEQSATNIVFRKIPALLFNRKMLEMLPGKLYTSHALSTKVEGIKYGKSSSVKAGMSCYLDLEQNGKFKTRHTRIAHSIFFGMYIVERFETTKVNISQGTVAVKIENKI